MSLCYLLLYIIDGDLKFLTQENEIDDCIMESQPAAVTNSGSSGSSNKATKFKEDEFVRLRRAKNGLKPE